MRTGMRSSEPKTAAGISHFPSPVDGEQHQRHRGKRNGSSSLTAAPNSRSCATSWRSFLIASASSWTAATVCPRSGCARPTCIYMLTPTPFKFLRRERSRVTWWLQRQSSSVALLRLKRVSRPCVIVGAVMAQVRRRSPAAAVGQWIWGDDNDRHHREVVGEAVVVHGEGDRLRGIRCVARRCRSGWCCSGGRANAAATQHHAAVHELPQPQRAARPVVVRELLRRLPRLCRVVQPVRRRRPPLRLRALWRLDSARVAKMTRVPKRPRLNLPRDLEVAYTLGRMG